ncbi:MAG TPA: bifunctional UDP-sugar hydrolase/5'-nucleotidase [Polyangiaceae bacterium]|nr:bifunctional UDP-sugar hydrolase/5'-nucleotidase [Polyangiaceae bacterium]
MRPHPLCLRLRLLVALLVFAGCAPAPPRELLPRQVVLLHLSDLHSHLFPDSVTLGQNDAERGLGRAGQTTRVGGVARIGSVLDAERARADVSVTLDAGDVVEGTAVYPLFGGVPEWRVEDALGVDAVAAGNHDLSAGAARLGELRGYAPRTALLAANLGAPSPATPHQVGDAALFAPSALIDRAGVRVRVIGLGHSPDAAPDVADCAARVQRVVDAAGADVVVVLSHLGSDLDERLVPLTTGIDVVLGGHTHDVLVPPALVRDCGAPLAARRSCRPRPVPVVHSGAYGRYVGKVALALSTDPADAESRLRDQGTPSDAARRATVADVHTTLIPVAENIEERADILELLEPYRRAMDRAGLSRPIAFAPRAISRTAPRGGDSALGNAVTQAMRTVTSADVALLNTTGIRDDLPAGVLTTEDVFRVLPFDDRLVVVEVTGRALRDAFERIRVDSCARDRTSQVQLDGATLSLACGSHAAADLRVGGHPLELGTTYRVATVSFLTASGQWLEGTADAGVPADAETLRDAFLDAVDALPACASDAGLLPCLDAAAGAATDGRITWR